jgi:hypothetical protein
MTTVVDCGVLDGEDRVKGNLVGLPLVVREESVRTLFSDSGSREV